MPILISAHQISKSFGAKPLFDSLSFSVESTERVGLIGPNGAGKSTLLRMLAGQMDTDSGSISKSRNLKIGFLEQVPQFKEEYTIHEALMSVVPDEHDWQYQSLAHELLSKFNLTERTGYSESTPVHQLSGGWKKRVALAREIMKQPDLLLLDEPTNHLDLESILWLEDYLSAASFATITITHDRAFLQKVSNRIIELDRRNPGGIISKVGTYAEFLETKELLISAQEKQEDRLRNTMRREVEWLRRGPQARLTKQQARINRAGEIISAVDDLAYRNRESTVQLDFISSEKKPKKLIEVKNISKSYNGRLVIPDLSLLIGPKSRIGLLGPNGCGKSTLIRLLIGTEEPDTGSFFSSEHLKVAYFEQNREDLDPDISLLKTICPLGDYVHFGEKPIHVRSYLDRFLFSPTQMDMPVGRLSGGEQSRLVLARLMLQSANVLVLDEPTNDLDTATLDVLEDVLKDFSGAVILVTHDRYFLDHVAETILAFDIDMGPVSQNTRPVGINFFSGLAQWENWREAKNTPGGQAQPSQNSTLSPQGFAQGTAKSFAVSQNIEAEQKKKRKLSFKEQRELDSIEENIQKAESRLKELEVEVVSPEVVSNAKRLSEITSEIAQLQAKVEQYFTRWSQLT